MCIAVFLRDLCDVRLDDGGVNQPLKQGDAAVLRIVLDLQFHYRQRPVGVHSKQVDLSNSAICANGFQWVW